MHNPSCNNLRVANRKIMTKLMELTTGLFLMCIIDNAHSDNLNTQKLTRVDCRQCHGDEGNSINPSLPSLAGQNKAYLIKQIKKLLKGERNHPLLGASTKKINEANIDALATYYSKSKAIKVNLEPTGSVLQLIKQGESIYTSCSGCHGEEAEGIVPYPKLAGQQPDYLKQQLNHFKTGKRMDTIMQMMTINLTDNEINALALYLSTRGKEKFQVRKNGYRTNLPTL